MYKLKKQWKLTPMKQREVRVRKKWEGTSLNVKYGIPIFDSREEPFACSKEHIGMCRGALF